MSIKKYLIFFSSLVAFIAALNYTVYAYNNGSFQKTATGLEYRVVQKGAGPRPQEGEIMLINMTCRVAKKVLLSTEEQGLPMAIPYTKDNKDGGLMEAVSLLQKDAKLLCRLDGTKIFGEKWAYLTQENKLNKDSQLLLDLHLQNIMTQEEYQKWEKEQITMLQQKQQEEAAKQQQEDVKIITSYLAEHEIKAEQTPSGLFYVIDKPGEGSQPQKGNTVKVNYTGQLLDGTVFDSSVEAVAKQHGTYNPHRTYEPIAFSLGVKQVIAGWDEGISLLKKGSKARLFIPSTLGYGAQGAGGLIPANAVLIFEVELVDIES